MKYTYLKKTAIVVASIALTSSAYAYNKDNAVTACIDRVTEHNTGKYHTPKHVRVSDKGHHSYVVTGDVASDRDGARHTFSCSIRHKELVNYHVNEPNSADGSHKNTAAAIGAGILALAVIAAANKDRHEGHGKGASPFSDMKYLKRQCKQNILHQIQADHPRRHIHKVKLHNVHLNHRTLKGAGEVIWRNRNVRDLSFSCDFDRRGKVYDGYYHFRRR